MRNRWMATGMGALLTLMLGVGGSGSRPDRATATGSLPGPLDLVRLAQNGFVFTEPSGPPPRISRSGIGRLVAGAPAAREARQVRYRYLLLTTSIAVTPKARRDDPVLAGHLRMEGHPVDLPVWVVSYEGVAVPSSDAPTHESNVIYDARSGDILWAFSYR